MVRTGIVTAAILIFGLSAYAQQSVTKGMTPVKAVVTIQAIDQTNRLVTIRDASGEEDTIYAGPEAKRFSELKVGDRVQLMYYESVVYRLGKPGEPLEGVAGTSGVTAAADAARPGGTVARQRTATVEVVSVDETTPSITVKTADGRTITRKVEDKKNIAAVKPGDRIEITYTEAVLMEVLAGK